MSTDFEDTKVSTKFVTVSLDGSRETAFYFKNDNGPPRHVNSSGVFVFL